MAAPFASFIHFGPECWEWMGGKSHNGYGNYKGEDRVNWRAHRYAWTMVNGPIPPGMVVCHRCDNRSCVRHDHLFLGTTSDNAIDCVVKKRHFNATKTRCPKGHEYAVHGGRVKAGGRYCKLCTSACNKRCYAAKKSF